MRDGAQDRTSTGRRRIGTLALATVLLVSLVAPVASAATHAGKRPGAEADVSDVQLSVMPEGAGIPQRSATAIDARAPLPEGYVETEYLFESTAIVYAGPVTGRVTEDSDGNAFATRLLVRAPAEKADFSGSVWVEPMNTTGGGDFDVIWAQIQPLIAERGDAWVGVTVRARQTTLLKELDPVRYADINLTENEFGWDILRQVGTLLKAKNAANPIGELRAKHIYMGGYSQSAVDTATFVSAIHDLTRLGNGAPVYDGYIIGGRQSNLSPLQSGDSVVPDFEHGVIEGVDVPVVDYEAQADVEGFTIEVPTALAVDSGLEGAEDITTPTFDYVTPGGATVRRPDSNKRRDHYRGWEIAGASHGTGAGAGCIGGSSFPIGAFGRAAASNLATWAEDATAPPRGDRIELAVQGDVSESAVDDLGITLGGVRSPFVDVPLSTYVVHSGPGPYCKLVGIETFLAPDVLTERYGTVEQYMREFTKSLDATIKAGFLLKIDRQAILDEQQVRADEAFDAA